MYVQLLSAQIVLTENRRGLVDWRSRKIRSKNKLRENVKADILKFIDAESEKSDHSLTKMINVLASFPCADTTFCERFGCTTHFLTSMCTSLIIL